MKHLTKFDNWSGKMNEGIIDYFSHHFQAAVIVSLLGLRGLYLLLCQYAKSVGEGVELSKDELKGLVETGLIEIRSKDKSGNNFESLEEELYRRIESEEIKTIKDIVKTVKSFT